ncbi:MAG: hypothetical protein ACLQT7_06100 [Candidatus Dormibacteria bacterium]
MARRTGLHRGAAVPALAALGALLASCGGTSASPTHTPRTSASSTASPTPTASATPSPATPAPTPIAGFQAASVTFVSSQDGWVLGTAGGGLALARTQDGGAYWNSVTPPPTGFYKGPGTSGVSGIRFANQQDGWAYGSQLWATHDGGASWAQVTLPALNSGGGMTPIQDLETAGGQVYAVYFGSSGFAIAGSPVGSNSWVVSSTGISFGAGPIPGAQMVIQGSGGWVLENDRTVAGGARLTGGAWSSWTPPCTTTGGPAALAASSAQDLIAACDVGLYGSGPPAERAYTSTDGGGSFTELATALPSSCQGSATIAGPSPSVAAAGCGGQIVATFNGGGSWSTVFSGGASTTIAYVGFTTSSQGVAISAASGSSAGALLMTSDGGHAWGTVTV